MEKVRSFTDLIAWKEAHKLVISIYKMTEDFPRKECFGLTDQIRRAAVSISSNIAEGFSRKTGLEKKHFYYISIGSLTEVQNQLLIARDVNYLSKEKFRPLADLTLIVSRLINSLVKNIDKYNSLNKN